jgi:hypothetical protein
MFCGKKPNKIMEENCYYFTVEVKAPGECDDLNLRIINRNRGQGPTKVCRAIDESMNE